MRLPASGGLVMTGQLSVPAQPWLADHVVAGQIVLPVRRWSRWWCGRVTRSAAPGRGAAHRGAVGAAGACWASRVQVTVESRTMPVAG